MNKNYENPTIEILEYNINIYASDDSSNVINPSPENSGNTGWLPWV